MRLTWHAAAALLVAAPATAQAPSAVCNLSGFSVHFCQLGPYSLEVGFDVFSPLIGSNPTYRIELYDNRIDFHYLVANAGVTPAPFLGDNSYYPFFEHQLNYLLFAPSSGYSVFRAALATSARATMNLPGPGSQLDFSAGFLVSNGLTGAGAGTHCPSLTTPGTVVCQLSSSQNDFLLPDLGDGYYGTFDLAAYYYNSGPGVLDGTFENMEATASLYLTRVTPVPEPATVGLLAIGLVGVGLVAWRRRR